MNSFWSPQLLSFSLLLLILVACSQPLVVMAQDQNPSSNLGTGIDVTAHDAADQSGLSALKINDVIINVLNYFLGLLGIVAMAVIMYAGGMYITSGGDEDKAHHAKQIITFAVIGILLVGLSAVIVNTVINQVIK